MKFKKKTRVVSLSQPIQLSTCVLSLLLHHKKTLSLFYRTTLPTSEYHLQKSRRSKIPNMSPCSIKNHIYEGSRRGIVTSQTLPQLSRLVLNNCWVLLE